MNLILMVVMAPAPVWKSEFSSPTPGIYYISDYQGSDWNLILGYDGSYELSNSEESWRGRYEYNKEEKRLDLMLEDYDLSCDKFVLSSDWNGKKSVDAYHFGQLIKIRKIK